MRMARRRVSEAPVADFDWSGEWPKPAWAIFRKARIFDPLRILHHRNTWNGVAQFSLHHPGSLDRRRTALIFIILDLAIQALKTLRPRWSFRWLVRPNRAPARHKVVPPGGPPPNPLRHAGAERQMWNL